MSNLQARESLERAKRLFPEKPAAARKPNTAATAVWRDGLSCEVSGPGAGRAITDMPEPMGGNAAGSNPGWLLRAGMASCAATKICACQSKSARTASTRRNGASWQPGAKHTRLSVARCGLGHRLRSILPLFEIRPYAGGCGSWWRG